MIYTYSNLEPDGIYVPSLNYALQGYNDAESPESTSNFDGTDLVVYSELPESTVDAIVASHDPNDLFSNQIRKWLAFESNTTVLQNNGIIYGGLKMPMGIESQAFYSSKLSDEAISYPVLLPSIGGGPLTIADKPALQAFIAEQDARMYYLWEAQQNADLSYGLLGYQSQIFSAEDMTELDAIVDTRS